jgi:hypothetical protein
VIALDSNVCNENGGTGIYIWDAVNLTTPVTGYQEYIWSITDGSTTQGGVLRMFDSTDSDRLREIWRLLKLDKANPATMGATGDINVGNIGGGDVIDINAEPSGEDIIQTRQP